MLITHLNFSSLIFMQLICSFLLFSSFPSSSLSPSPPLSSLFPSSPLQKGEWMIISIQKYLTQLNSRKCTQVSKRSATRKQREEYRGGEKKIYSCEYSKHRLYSCVISYLFIIVLIVNVYYY